MTSSEPGQPTPPAKKPSKNEAARRRRAAELLGELMPDVTSDETDEGWGERREGSRDEEFLRDVPPHHG